jgi:hypothetical protein
MDHTIARTLTSFTALGLDALNAKAAMLERLDNKYIIAAHDLGPALQAFGAMFDVLEIEGKRAFSYATRYFDDVDRRAYYDHHQGRRKRCKVRVRHYVDAGFSYLEVKLKDVRGATQKKRLRVDTGMDVLDDRCRAFVNTCYSDLYGQPFDTPLQAVIGMDYERITLVAKDGGERMTIDTGMEFRAGGMGREVSPDYFIVETKSARCSKYCIGMAALDLVDRRNRFLPALRRLELLTPALAA